jgi:glycosyltransferase involved in cell wall biosynthesis
VGLRITVITPSFNQGKFIRKTIESVLSQDYPNIEYFVIDGGSQDETLEVLRSYGDKVRWISEKDSGQSEAINKGFRMATGDILCWINSDDVLLPGALRKVAEYFAAHPEVAMVYGEGYMIDEQDNIKQRFPFTEPKFDLWKLVYVGDYLLQQSTFFRRSVFEVTPMLDEKLHYGLDWDLFIRIGKRFPVHYIPEYLGSIREHGEAKTSIGGEVRFRELVGVIRKHGMNRYPLSYLNYAWDTYGSRFARAPLGGEAARSLKGLALSLVRKFARRIWEWLYARAQQGYYPDGWAGKRAMFLLPNLEPGEPSRSLRLAGEAFVDNIPFRLRVSVNKRVRKSCSVKRAGTFDIRIPLPAEVLKADSFHVRIDCSRVFPARDGDAAGPPRMLGYLARDIGIVPGGIGIPEVSEGPRP